MPQFIETFVCFSFVFPGRLRGYLKYLADQPHIAAQERDDKMTEWMMKKWIEAGMDKVELATYDFYLSWPNQTNPNKVCVKILHC